MVFAPGDFLDWQEMFAKYGPWFILGLFALWGLLRLAKKYVETLVLTASGDIVKFKEESSETLELTRRLIERTDRNYAVAEKAIASLNELVSVQQALADEDQWKHCPVEHCPSMLKLGRDCIDTKDAMVMFVDEARTSRQTTQKLLEEIRAMLDTKTDRIHGEILAFTKDLGKEMINVIRNGRHKQ